MGAGTNEGHHHRLGDGQVRDPVANAVALYARAATTPGIRLGWPLISAAKFSPCRRFEGRSPPLPIWSLPQGGPARLRGRRVGFVSAAAKPPNLADRGLGLEA